MRRLLLKSAIEETGLQDPAPTARINYRNQRYFVNVAITLSRQGTTLDGAII